MECKTCKKKTKLFWNCCPYCGAIIEYSKFVYIFSYLISFIILIYGFFNSLYGSLIAIALILNFAITYNLGKKNEYNNFEILCLIFFEMIGIIVGAKLLTYLVHFNEYENFNFFKLGLSAYGAVIGALIMVFIYKLIFRKESSKLFSMCLIPMPLMYAIGKVGCFVAGCCYGIEYSGPLYIAYSDSLVAPNNVKLFPIQAVEALLFLAIFLYLFFEKKLSIKNKIAITFILCGTIKFVLDFLRASHVGIILSANQIISLIFIVIGLLMLCIKTVIFRSEPTNNN